MSGNPRSLLLFMRPVVAKVMKIMGVLDVAWTRD